MTSSRPYLIRALYEWITDNDMTPHLVVDASVPGVTVPASAIQNGKVTLNVAPAAINGLALGNDTIEFAARFSGVSHTVTVPVEAVMAIFARENGQGMMFPQDDGGNDRGPGEDDGGPSAGGGRGGHLKVVK